MADAAAPNQLFEQWRKQFEEGAQAWARLVTPPAPAAPPDPTAFWRPVLDQGVQTWAKLRVEVMIGGRTLTPRSGRGHPQGARTPKADSLHGDALREVARLVHVAAEPHGDVVGEKLERDRHDQRLEPVQDVRDGKDHISLPADLRVAFRDRKSTR